MSYPLSSNESMKNVTDYTEFECFAPKAFIEMAPQYGQTPENLARLLMCQFVQRAPQSFTVISFSEKSSFWQKAPAAPPRSPDR